MQNIVNKVLSFFKSNTTVLSDAPTAPAALPIPTYTVGPSSDRRYAVVLSIDHPNSTSQLFMNADSARNLAKLLLAMVPDE